MVAAAVLAGLEDDLRYQPRVEDGRWKVESGGVALATAAGAVRQPLDGYQAFGFEPLELGIAGDDGGAESPGQSRSKAVRVGKWITRFDQCRGARQLPICIDEVNWPSPDRYQCAFGRSDIFLSRNAIEHLTHIDDGHPARVLIAEQQSPDIRSARLAPVVREHSVAIEDETAHADVRCLRRDARIFRSSSAASRRRASTRRHVMSGSPGLRLNMPVVSATGSSGTRMICSTFSALSCLMFGKGGRTENCTVSPGSSPISSRISFGITTQPLEETLPVGKSSLEGGSFSLRSRDRGMPHLPVILFRRKYNWP